MSRRFHRNGFVATDSSQWFRCNYSPSVFSVLNGWQLKRIADYNYETENRTLLDPIFQVFWRWLVEKLPLWLAPTVLTTAGLLMNVVIFLIVMSHSPQAKQEVPQWVFFLCAIGVFVYQTLDALDGKQYYRTGRDESPLEELTDHAADSISIVLLVLQVSVAWQLGNTPIWMFFFCFSGLLLFYCFHWQVYVTRIIRFGKIDVTEVQVAACLVFLATATYGQSIWMIQVPFLDVQLKTVGLWVSACGVIYAFCALSWQGYQYLANTGSTWQGHNAFLPLMPISAILSMAVFTARSSPTNLLQNHPCLFVLTFGLVFSKLIIKLVITCLSKAPAEMTDELLAVGALQILNVQLGSWIDEYSLMCVMLTWVVLELLRYGCGACNDISLYCNLSIFSLGPRVNKANGVKD